MKSNNTVWWYGITAMMLSVVIVSLFSITALATATQAEEATVATTETTSEVTTDTTDTTEDWNTQNIGAAVTLDADITLDEEALNKIAEEATRAAKEKKDAEKNASKLVMVNVQESMNIRSEAKDDAEKVGQMYRDCGGDILERENGWTKIKSGSLEGWAKDEYLLFDQDAENLASEVGNLVATVDTEQLSVRKSADEDAEVFGVLSTNDEVIALEENGPWVSIDFGGEIGYVASEYVTVKFKIDTGETIEAINARAEKEAEEKAAKEKARKEAQQKAQTEQSATTLENKGAVTADISEEALLAALIQCEAGGESFEGQLAVGAVVLNRMRSGAYPNSMQGVIYASGQFTPAMNGKVDRTAAKGAKASCIQAAQAAIAGASNVGDATHFRRAGSKEGIVIGNHVFW
ncbi:MAG: cell wall hydrolase [Lachnospiraceae bacterium]